MKQSIVKRMLAAALSLLMLCTLLPTTALAEETNTLPPIISFYQNQVLTSSNAHAMQCGWLFSDLDLSVLDGGTLYLEYDIKVDSTHTQPPPANDDWIQHIVNGFVKINDIQVDTLGYNRSEPSFTTAGKWTSFKVALPEGITKLDTINKIQFVVHNDTGSKYPNSPEYFDNGIVWSNNHGATFSLRNVRITAGADIKADFSRLCRTLVVADITLNDGLAYTADTLAKLNEALLAVKTITFDSEPALVTATEKAITNAILDLRYALGDVNGNGSITAEDALMALQISTAKFSYWITNSYAGNVDGIDGVTASDALLILQYATKKLTQFPADAV